MEDGKLLYTDISFTGHNMEKAWSPWAYAEGAIRMRIDGFFKLMEEYRRSKTLNADDQSKGVEHV